MSFSPKTALPVIIKATLVAGTLDISIALLQYYIITGKNPVMVLNYIASAVFGEAAFAGGNVMAISGSLFHYIIAGIWTVLFFMIYPLINRTIKSAAVAGILYGIIIWLVMTQIIVPLSAAPKLPFNIAKAMIALLIIIMAVGLPISLMISKYFKKENKIK